jgi:hypothetical protein
MLRNFFQAEDRWKMKYPFRIVGVGIMITHNPLHGSGQAGFPHPAQKNELAFRTITNFSPYRVTRTETAFVSL